LSKGDFASVVDACLYLPEAWRADSVRCDEAGIPQESRSFKKKWELAIDVIARQKSLGVDFDYAGGDGYCGNSLELARAINEMNYVYMLDVHSDLNIYPDKPETGVPVSTGKRGKKPTKARALSQAIRVDKYMSGLSAKDWKTLKVRNTTKGILTGDYHFRRVYVWDGDNEQLLSRLLIIRRTQTKKVDYEYKYSFTNANLAQYTETALACMQAQRFFVEHYIKENKQISGMDKYQTRKWSAWRHQIALNFLISNFILKEKLLCFDNIPLLSARDVKRWIVFKLHR
jgi:SRSO17 transposase